MSQELKKGSRKVQDPSHGTADPLESFRAYCQLIRLPNLFTAAADALAGFLVTHPRIAETDLSPLWLLVFSSVAFYAGGVVLNDWADREVDRRERPHRPIPSGAVSARAAWMLGVGFLVFGLILTASVAWQRHSPWPIVVAVVLTLAIVFYNFWAKQFFVGPVVMGLCRAENLLLGASLGIEQLAHFWPVPLGLGMYVVGISVFARRETERSPRRNLAAGLCLMFAGLGILGVFPLTTQVVVVSQERLWLLLAVLALWMLVRGVWTLAEPVPRRVQITVTQAVMGIIVLDAAAVFVTHGPMGALPILALVLPTTWAARWIAAT